MTVSASTRLAITRWSAGTDPFTRAQMDASFATLDDLVAIDLQGAWAARPAAGVRGRYYTVVDVGNAQDGYVYRDNGTGWTLLNAPSAPLGSTAAVVQAIGDAAAVGVATTSARADHRHGMPAFGAVVAGTAFGAAAANGTAATIARSDHTHGTPATPPYGVVRGNGAASAARNVLSFQNGTGTTVVVSDDAANAETDVVLSVNYGTTVVAEQGYGQASAVGTAALASRADHSHGSPALTAVAPTTAVVGDAAAVGTGTAPAREDHRHGLPAFGAVAAATTFGIAAANGVAATIARSDHTHGTPTLTYGAAVAETGYGQARGDGVSASVSRADHTHGTPPMPTAAQVGALPIGGATLTGNMSVQTFLGFAAGDASLDTSEAGFIRFVNAANSVYKNFKAGAIYDTNARVYSPNNPPPETGMKIITAVTEFLSSQVQSWVTVLTFVAPASGNVVAHYDGGTQGLMASLTPSGSGTRWFNTTSGGGPAYVPFSGLSPGATYTLYGYAYSGSGGVNGSFYVEG